jgi:hypothetical protein
VLQFLGMELPATGRATDGLKTWQRTCLQELGLLQVATAGAGASATATAGTPSSSSSSSSSGGTVAAPAGEAHTETASSSSSSAAAAAAAAATDGDGSGSTVTSLAGEGPAPQQQQQQLIRLGGDPPINAELLALLRVLLCQVRAHQGLWGVCIRVGQLTNARGPDNCCDGKKQVPLCPPVLCAPVVYCRWRGGQHFVRGWTVLATPHVVATPTA